MALNERQKAAMKHEDVLGAGAAKRRKLPSEERYEVVMAEFRRGTLYSGSGHKVKSEKQARAIAYAESHPKESQKKGMHYNKSPQK